MEIYQLKEKDKSFIRSGVVISCVSQCITELVLNALDAGASRIGVRFDLTKFQLQVVDDGTGMNKEQLDLIGDRYMTSKPENNLQDTLKYCGYRGEVLASLRKVCDSLLIFSKPLNNDVTFCKVMKPNDHEYKEATVAQLNRPGHGTTVVVMNLFGNLPVRQKRLHHALEAESIRSELQNIALIHPQVSFTLRNDHTKTIILYTKKCTDILENFNQIFESNTTLKEFVYVSTFEGTFKISGYVCRETAKSKKYQFLYVNNRYIRKSKLHSFINNKLKKSFYLKKINCDNIKSKDMCVSNSSFMMSTDDNMIDLLKDNYAVFIIIIECQFSDFDITYDPKSWIIEFKNLDVVYGLIDKCINEFLRSENHLHNAGDQINLNSVTIKLSEKTDKDDSNYNEHNDCSEIAENNLFNDKVCDTSSVSTGHLICGTPSRKHVSDEEYNNCVLFSKSTNSIAHSEHLLTECDECKLPFMKNCDKSSFNSFDVYNKKTIIPITCYDFYENNLQLLKANVECLNRSINPTLKFVTPKNVCIKKEKQPKFISIKEIRKYHRKSDLCNNFSNTNNKKIKKVNFTDNLPRVKGDSLPRAINNNKMVVNHYESMAAQLKPKSILKNFTKSYKLANETVNKDIKSCYKVPNVNKKKVCHYKLKKSDKFFSACNKKLKNECSNVMKDDRNKKIKSEKLVTNSGDFLSVEELNESKCRKEFSSLRGSCDKSSDYSKRIQEKIIKSNQFYYNHEEYSNRTNSISTIFTNNNNCVISNSFQNDKNQIQDKVIDRYCTNSEDFILDQNENHSIISTDNNNFTENEFNIKIEDLNCETFSQVASSVQLNKKILRLLDDNKENINYLDKINFKYDKFNTMNSDNCKKLSKTQKFTVIRKDDFKPMNCATREVRAFAEQVPQRNCVSGGLHNFIGPITCIDIKDKCDFSNNNYTMNKLNDGVSSTSKNTVTVWDYHIFMSEIQNKIENLKISNDSDGVNETMECISNYSMDCEVNSQNSSLSILNESAELNSQKHEEIYISNDNDVCNDTKVDKNLIDYFSINDETKSYGIKESNIKSDDYFNDNNTLDVSHIKKLSSEVSEMKNSFTVSQNENFSGLLSIDTDNYEKSFISKSGIFNFDIKCAVSKEKNRRFANKNLKSSILFDNDENRCLNKNIISLSTEKCDNLNSSCEVLEKIVENDLTDCKIFSGKLKMPMKRKFQYAQDFKNLKKLKKRYDPEEEIFKTIEILAQKEKSEIQNTNEVISNSGCPDLFYVNQNHTLQPTENFEFKRICESKEPSCLSVQNDIIIDRSDQYNLLNDTTVNGDIKNLESLTSEFTGHKIILGETFDNNLKTDLNEHQMQDSHFENSNSDELPLILSDWKEHTLSSGENVYIHSKSGMSSYSFLKHNTNDYDITSRCWFWPKGLSPLQDTNNINDSDKFKLDDGGRNEVLNVIVENDKHIDENYNRNTSNVAWNDCRNGECDVLTAIKPSSSSNNFKCARVSAPTFSNYAFTKDDLSNAQVIGLFDEKFIVTTMVCCHEKLIVIFDQHAVDERIRYENLCKDYKIVSKDGVGESFRQTSLNPPLVLTLSKYKTEIIQSFIDKFENIGLKIIVNEKSTMTVNTVPSCLFSRADKESSGQMSNKLTDLVHKLLDEQIESIINTNGVGLKTPHILNSLICFEACRSAVKFGDKITMSTARSMIERLSKCVMPFQCAHGRPVFAPLYNFGLENK